MKLLIIEDNQELAENLAEIFEAEGYDVERAATGAEGLAAAAGGFDLALVDVRLPDTTGTRLLPDLRRCAPLAEVIISTANADVDSAVEAVQAGAFAYLNKPARIEELLVTVQRARERVELRRHSHALQRRLTTVVAHVPAVILILDEEHCIRFASPRVQSILGFSDSELIGTPFRNLCPEHPPLDLVGSSSFEVTCRDKHGQPRRMFWRWAPGAEEQDALFGIGTDMTERVELERRAAVAEKLAVAGTLTAGLAHEIRNPLNAAGLQLSVLRRMLKGVDEAPQLLGPLEIVRSELNRLDGLLQDFLAFARPREYRLASSDLTALTRHVVELERAEAESAGCRLIADLAESVTTQADFHALEQVVLNLLKNAVEAAKTEVRVCLRTDGDRALIEVADDGPGMSADVIDRLFEPFFTTKPAGTGLGMAIAHTIVAGHGGKLDVASQVGEGSQVTVNIPLVGG